MSVAGDVDSENKPLLLYTKRLYVRGTAAVYERKHVVFFRFCAVIATAIATGITAYPALSQTKPPSAAIQKALTELSDCIVAKTFEFDDGISDEEKILNVVKPACEEKTDIFIDAVINESSANPNYKEVHTFTDQLIAKSVRNARLEKRKNKN